MINCLLIGNSVEGDNDLNHGGAIEVMTWGNLTATNCTFMANSAQIGGAVWTAANGATGNSTLANCVLWGNTAPNDPQISGPAAVSYSCIQDGWPGDGNISDDPLLVDADGPDGDPETWEDGDYHLSSSSPCIDAGDKTAIPADILDLDGDTDTDEPIPVDLDGGLRFTNITDVPDTGFGDPPIVDMGPYECPDCNGNGIPDEVDISQGTSQDDNENGIPDECDIAPTAVAEGCRYLAVTPAAGSDAVALLVSSPAYPCLEDYVGADGVLTDSPLYQTPAEWGTVHVRGEPVVPETEYHVQAKINGGEPSISSVTTTWIWGDVNDDEVVGLADILLIIAGFQGDFTGAQFESCDIDPCTPDRVIGLGDVLACIAAFQGVSYTDRCPEPCSP